MKVASCLLVILGCSLAVPSPPLAWKDIKGKNAYIEPINNYTADIPVGGRVIGGSEVARNSVPYQVAILIDGRSFCGGSLISNNFVLTAAHCTIDASFVQLIFGAHNVHTTESTQIRVTSSNIINHPNYQPAGLRNDVALVRLPTAIVTNSNIQIITLAAASAGAYAGADAYLTGWGKMSDASTTVSSNLRGVTLNIITNVWCQLTYGMAIVESTLCTSGAGTVGACQGDSGGPLVVDGVQVGVTSFVSASGCERGLPSGFARVSSFRNWISQNSDVSL